MRRKKVWRYYCEFCGKGGCSGGHMAAHERSCTMNPDRVCRMCAWIDDHDQLTMPELRRLLPDTVEVETQWGATYIQPVVPGDVYAVMFAALQRASADCPACILAALRQTGLSAPQDTWSYAAACKAFWDEYNEGDERD